MENWPIRKKLILTFTLIVAALMILLMAILIPERIRTEQAARVQRISMLADLLVESDQVKDAIADGRADNELIEYLDNLVDQYSVDFIVLAQLDGRRVYHPDHTKINQYFVGGDDQRIRDGAVSYVSIANGTTDRQQRAFCRVQKDDVTIGFVMVSLSLHSIYQEQLRLVIQLLMIFIIVFVSGFFAFQYIADSLQRILLGYEPEEFANIYRQGEQMLRASTHEFLNKMHVISGLLQMGENEDALEYIGVIAGELEGTQRTIIHNIENPTISALLLGKISRARELDIQFSVRNDSHLRVQSPYLSTNDLITIIGNLIENAFHAVKDSEGMRVVEFFIGDSEEGLIITVDDTGHGLTPKQIKLLKKKVYTTRGKGHGNGLRMIRGIVQRRDGYLDIESEVGEGSSFTVSFHKTRREYSC